MASSIQALLWDNDGVLVDTEGLFFQANRAVLAEAGIGLSREEFILHSLVEGRSAFEFAVAKGFPEAEVPRLRMARDCRYAWLLKEVGPSGYLLEGVREVLAALHGRIRMGVVTGSKRAHFEQIHAASGLLGFFDFIYTREDYRQAKPDPEPYLTALQRQGLDAGACVAVEDSERGVRSAVQAGIRCLALPTDLTRGNDFTLADRVLTRVDEVLAEVGEW